MRTVASAGARGDVDEPGVARLAAAQIAERFDSPLAAVMRFNATADPTVLGQTGPFPFPFPTTLAADDHATVTPSSPPPAGPPASTTTLRCPSRLPRSLWSTGSPARSLYRSACTARCGVASAR
ncbi:MAG: hypothetical protein ABSH51_12310 [Solirubrobacteraceae bacterium]|jgi:hypothetical protein